MWWSIENSYAKLSKEDKDRVEKEAPLANVTFPGFDGNIESEHLSIARLLIRDLKRFPDVKDRVDGLNSHMPTIEMYRRMLPVCESMRPGLGGGNLLDAGQIIALLKARRHDGGK